MKGLGASELAVFVGTSLLDGSAPEWKEFFKIAGFGKWVASDLADIQIVAFFGMGFGPCHEKIS